MKKLLAFLFISLLFSGSLTAQKNSPNTGIAVKSYFLKRKKIMATYYNLGGLPIMEWCSKPAILNLTDLFPYVRFYHYDGDLITTTTYAARLVGEKEVIFNDPNYPLVQVTKMRNGICQSSINCFPQADIGKFALDEIMDVNLTMVRELVFASGSKLVSDDGSIRTELYPYFFLIARKKGEYSEPLESFAGRQLFKIESYFDESGRIFKKREYAMKDFTFSKTPVFKVKSETRFIYVDRNTERIFKRDRQKMHTYRILVKNEYH